ncbi:GNAT family N-acetyltransferase [Trichormus variabilis]|uniref:N-acetyltransferase n=1 Tax=Trichormus variabilis SAG 1403-4b TaxID=447716 RepID=A0A3S1C1S1_ANAVA|nr:GNAT family N-acetyltransferase [Trichormus variabilis]MBD2624947.1 GNAT family N-acetyltransferase [Trichormus variabilis FACHB-164]RUS95116.1 N-acetyltransferase [Trichormus variabilis SAG 1403-4b]
MKIIELLNKSHNRESFNCGNEILNQFLKRTARQHIQKGISRTFVLVETEQPQTIIGFFTLSICEVKTEKLPPQLSKKYPTKVAGVKLARLAVSQDWQRQGIGEILMIEAMKRALVISDNAGVIGLFVNAKDEKAQAYYQRYGFVSLVDIPLEMFLPLETVKQLF